MLNKVIEEERRNSQIVLDYDRTHRTGRQVDKFLYNPGHYIGQNLQKGDARFNEIQNRIVALQNVCRCRFICLGLKLKLSSSIRL